VATGGVAVFTSRRGVMVAVYSIIHLLVDFTCAFLMFRYVFSTPVGYACMLIYNFCAFAMQMPMGVIADSLNRNHLFALSGCLLIAVTCFPVGVFTADRLSVWAPIAMATIAGIGNGMFHVGAGTDVLNISTEKSGALGVFVSPGAFGVYFGTLLGKNTATVLPVQLVVTMLVIAAAAIVVQQKIQGSSYQGNSEFSLVDGLVSRDNSSAAPAPAAPAPAAPAPAPVAPAASTPTTPSAITIAAACFFTVVFLRSYIGLTLVFPWKSLKAWAMVLVTAVVLGKAFGGFLADIFGMSKTSRVTLALSAVLFFFPQFPLTGVLSVLLFNMTMPITLWAMARIFPGAKGFSFGLLTSGLFTGFLPVYLGIGTAGNPVWFYAMAAVASLVTLAFGLRKARL